ncbi:MAG: hypothetical protein KC543_07665 [Myxococcales bacterium]|nr:hypothetical protein [Myxococcales bacterium]
MRLDLLTVALACAAACSTAAPALAHHGSSVARVGGGASMAWTPASASVPPPRLDLGVSYSVNYFGRTLEGHSSVGGDGLGKVLVHLVTPSARLALRHGTTVGVALPVGTVRTYPPGGATSTSGGLGDLSAFVSQDLGRLWGGGGAHGHARHPHAHGTSHHAHHHERAFGLALRAGLTAPTGRYRPAGDLSVTDVHPGPGGSLMPHTFNSQTSLGAGVWAIAYGADAWWRAHPRVRLSAGLDASSPVSTTSDDIRWGTDLTGSVGATLELVHDAVWATVSADARWHARDRIPVVSPVTDETTHERAGSRVELGAAAGLSTLFARRLSCSLSVHVPYWQRAGGIQLVETVSGNARCTVGIGL